MGRSTLIDDVFWVTNNGDLIKYEDLPTKHLENILNSREDKFNENRLKRVKQELRHRKLNNLNNLPDNKDIF